MYVTLSEIISMLGMITIKLRENNYLRWRYQFQTVLEGGDLFCYFDGTYPIPPEIVLTDAYKIWKKNDKALLSLLIATLDEDIMDAVVGSKSSREAWLCLQERFVPSSRADVIRLETNLLSIKKGSDSIERYLLKIKHNKDLLSVVGVTFSDDDIVVLTLNGLPDEYAMLKMVIRGRESLIDAKDFRFQLLAAERDIEGFMCYSSNMSMLGKCHSQKSLDKNSCSESHGGRYNDALVCRNRLNYAFKGSDPCTTLNGMTVHNTNGGTSSVSTFAYGFSSILKSDQLQVIPPTSSTFGNSCDTHIVVSSTVVDGGEQNEVNGSSCDVSGGSVGEVNFVSDNSNSPRSGGCVGEVNSVGDNSCSFGSGGTSFGSDSETFVIVGGDNRTSSDSDGDVFGESQNELEKVVDDDESVSSDSDEVVFDCGGSLRNGKNVGRTTEFHRYPCKRVGHVCGDDCYELPGEKKADENTDINDVTMEYVLPLLPAKTLCRFRSVSKHWDQWITYPLFTHKQAYSFRNISDFFCQLPGEKPSFVSLNRDAYGIPNASLDFLPESVTVRTACNGLLCCKSCDGENTYYICNPVNKEWTVLPKSYHGPESVLALAFEPSVLGFEENFQLVCAFSLPDQPVMYFDIYSSRSRSWKCSETICCEIDALHLTGHGLFLKGMIFWETPSGTILAFNLKEEHYGILPPLSGPRGVMAEMYGEMCYILPVLEDLVYTLEIYGDLQYVENRELKAFEVVTVGCLVGGAIAQLIRTIATKVAGLVITSKMMYEGASRIITDVVGSIRTVVSSCAKEKFGKIPSLTVSISALLPQLRLREGVNRIA